MNCHRLFSFLGSWLTIFTCILMEMLYFFYSFGHILFWMVVVVVVVVVLVICRRGALSWMTNWKLLVLVGNYIIGTLEFSIFDIFCED